MGCGGSKGGAGSKDAQRTNQQIEEELARAREELKHEIKLLLLGAGESGKSTLAKQMKILHLNGYTQEEALKFKAVVYNNTVSSMRVLCLACHELNIQVEPQNRVITFFSPKFLKKLNDKKIHSRVHLRARTLTHTYI